MMATVLNVSLETACCQAVHSGWWFTCQVPWDRLL